MEIYDLIQCVDRGLEQVGSGAKQAFYLTVTLSKGLPFEDLVTNPDAMVEMVKEVFNDSCDVVNRSIVKEIKQVFGLKNPVRSYNLLDALNIALKNISGVVQMNYSRR